MPVHSCDPSALADKVAELEAAGETILALAYPNELSAVLVTKVDGRRKPRGLETR